MCLSFFLPNKVFTVAAHCTCCSAPGHVEESTAIHRGVECSFSHSLYWQYPLSSCVSSDCVHASLHSGTCFWNGLNAKNMDISTLLASFDRSSLFLSTCSSFHSRSMMSYAAPSRDWSRRRRNWQLRTRPWQMNLWRARYTWELRWTMWVLAITHLFLLSWIFTSPPRNAL